MSVQFHPEKTYSYLKGMAMGLGWTDTVRALAIARRDHEGQMRKNGEPYFIHPLTVASHAVALGLKEDKIVATALLHDWKEDCKGDVRLLPCSQEVKNAVTKLSFEKKSGISKQDQLVMHYDAMREDKIACIVKLLDRCHNVSTMAGVFTSSKLQEYIEETNQFILPLLRYTKDTWPEYSDQLFVLKYHIVSVVDAIDIVRKVSE